MYKVIKRDGSVAEFDIAKISGAIAKAFGALNKPCDPNDIDFIALKVTADFEDKIKDDLISVEAIQDSAEQVLIQSGHSDVAKAYIPSFMSFVIMLRLTSSDRAAKSISLSSRL